MKIKPFDIKVFKNRIIRALFSWSLLVPSKAEPAKPFDAKITSSETEDESWIDSLDIAEDSILRQTNPLLMTRKERHENTVRYWMERKGFDRKDIEKPLTDERMKELGRMTYSDYKEENDGRKKKYIERFGTNDPMSQAILSDRPSDLDLLQEIKS
jgi:hypothetical protein